MISGNSIKTLKASGVGDELHRTARLLALRVKATTTERTASRMLVATDTPGTNSGLTTDSPVFNLGLEGFFF